MDAISTVGSEYGSSRNAGECRVASEARCAPWHTLHGEFCLPEDDVHFVMIFLFKSERNTNSTISTKVTGGSVLVRGVRRQQRLSSAAVTIQLIIAKGLASGLPCAYG